MNILDGDKVKLRALEPEDVDILYTWENDTDVWMVSTTVAPLSKSILKRFIDEQEYDIFDTKQFRLIIESKESGEPIGTIDLFDLDIYQSRAGIGIMIFDNKERRRGYASSALSLFIKYSFEVLGLHQLYCNITSDNQRSLNLFESKGFELVGVKQDWIRTAEGWQDEYLLQLINIDEDSQLVE